MASFRVNDQVVLSDGRVGTYMGQGVNSTVALVRVATGDGFDTLVVNVASIRKQK